MPFTWSSLSVLKLSVQGGHYSVWIQIQHVYSGMPYCIAWILAHFIEKRNSFYEVWERKWFILTF